MNTRSAQIVSSTEHVEIPSKKPVNQPEPTKSSSLRTIDCYSGFVTNKVFEECRPFEQFVYAAVQYLSFHQIKPSCRNIAKHVSLSDKVIKNALCFLRKERSIVKQTDGGYLFGNTKLDGSTELLGAKEISDIRLGYWFPIDVLKSEKITNQAKRAFAVILSLTKSGSNQIDMVYIGIKLGLTRQSASQPIACLLREGLISRQRNHDRIAYFYKVGTKATSYKQDLSTANEVNSSNFKQQNTKGHPDVTSKGHPDVTSLSIKESNIYLIDKRKDRSTSDTYKSGENKDISFLKEEEIKLDAQYTMACNELDWGGMCQIGTKMAMIRVKILNSQRRTRYVY